MRYLLIGLLFLAGCQKQTENQSTLILGTNAVYPPYESVGKNGQVEGFDIDMAQDIAKKLNTKLIIKELSFDALILALKQGKVDFIMSGISITDSRQKEIAMIPYQGEQVKHLCLTFWEKEPTNNSKLVDLQPLAVQVATYQEGYLQTVEKVQVKSLEGNPEIIMDLQYGKSKAAIFEPHIAKAMQKKFPQLICKKLPLDKEHWVLGNGIGVKKENTQLVEEIQEAVKSLKKENVIEKLEAKWMGS